jgi:hypothetical protein
METNPYATPQIGDDAAPVFLDAMAELVRSWEKFRLYYNGILLLPGLGVLTLFVTRLDMPAGGAAASGTFVAVGANIAFFLGPLAELYLRGFLLGGRALGRGRLLIFAAGVMVSFGLFAVIALLASQ